MKKPNLKGYTSRQIFEGMLELDLGTFMELLMATSKFLENTQKRGAAITNHQAEENFEKYLSQEKEI